MKWAAAWHGKRSANFLEWKWDRADGRSQPRGLCGAERAAVASARRDIFRYSKWPTQAITYHLGKAEILALREECQAVEGPVFSERRFQEEFLSEGQIPPGAFRARVLAKARARSAATGAPDATNIGISR